MKTEWASFGEYLRYWRERSKLTQPQLAKATDTSKQNISNLERGQEHPLSGAIAKPSLELAIKLAKKLDRPVEEFLVIAGLIESGDVGNAIREGSSQSSRDVIPSPDTRLAALHYRLQKLPPKVQRQIDGEWAKVLEAIDREIDEREARGERPPLEP